MGFLSSLLPIAGAAVGNMIAPGIGGAIGGALGSAVGGSGSKQSGTSTATTQQQLDPRIQAMLFGTSGSNGLLSQYQSLLNTPQSDAAKAYAGAAGDYLTQYGSQGLGAINNAAMGLMSGSAAPQASPSAVAAPATSNAAMVSATPNVNTLLGSAAQTQAQEAAPVGAVVASQIKAPDQNNLSLAPAYQSMIYGNSAQNPYLTSSLQSAVDLTNASYQKNQKDLTNNLMRNILPSLRSNSVLAGQYGGSRQGIAEGNALSDYTNQLTNANTQLGLANSANTTGQQASSYENGQNRALTAMQGLGAQQYGVASENAGYQQQANITNAANQMNMDQFNANQQQQANNTNAGLQQQMSLANLSNGQQTNLANQNAALQTNLANAGYQQQTGLSNASNQQQANLTNAGYQQQTSLANLQALLQSQQQNNSAALGGAGLLGGLLSQASGTVNAQDNYGLARAQGVNSLLAPYLSANSSTSTSSPLYSNTTGNLLGGAMLGSQLKNLFGGTDGSGSVENYLI